MKTSLLVAAVILMFTTHSFGAKECTITFKPEKPKKDRWVPRGELTLHYVEYESKLVLASSEWSKVDEPNTLFRKGGWAKNPNHRQFKSIRMEAVDLSDIGLTPLKVTKTKEDKILVSLENVRFFPNSANDNHFTVKDVQFDSEKNQWIGQGTFEYSSWAGIEIGEVTGTYESTTLSADCLQR